MKQGFVALSIILCVAANTCVPPSPLTLQLLLEYANWRSWDQVVLFDNLGPTNCAIDYARPLIKCFGERGISVSIQSATNPNIPEALVIRRHRVGSIVLLDGLNLTSPENVLQVASQKQLYNYYVSWFMVTATNTDATIDTVLRDLNIGIDSEVVVATSSLSVVAASNYYRSNWNRTCPTLWRYGKHFRFRDPPPRRASENAIVNLNYVVLGNRTVSFFLVHVYKVRNSDNTSLVANFLGWWNPGSSSLRRPVSVKLRNNFNGVPIIFGVLNGTNDGQTDVIDEVEANDIAPLLDFAAFVTNNLNASMELVPHEKLGTMTNKVWSNLLGDVVSGAVDIGLGYITINDERQSEMSFSHPLIRYMRNIYYHPLETGTMRDIFLQPFNNRLLGCVAATYFIILISMGIIIYAAKTVLHDDEETHVGLGEAALWCMSIMCMQGSPWTPRTPSGKTLLLFSLMFALVTYNAYAGFITSILSVQASGIKSITDLLFNNFKLGYSVTDDEYIRDVNDTNLRQLYIKAFNSRESRLDTTSGLMKAVQGRYGFFVSATLARHALRTTLIHERCSLKELTLRQTFTFVALPMANSCPYKKIINLSILRIHECGVLSRIAENMLPEMPRCKAPTTFHSARLADVYSAFVILIAGLVTAVSIGIFERIWNKRRQMQETIVRGIREHHFIPHIHFHHHAHAHHPQQHQYQPTYPMMQTFRGTPITKNQTIPGYEQFYAPVLQSHPHSEHNNSSMQRMNGSDIANDRQIDDTRSTTRKRSSGKTKRSSWASFSGLSKKKTRRSVNDSGNVIKDPVFPFQN